MTFTDRSEEAFALRAQEPARPLRFSRSICPPVYLLPDGTQNCQISVLIFALNWSVIVSTFLRPLFLSLQYLKRKENNSLTLTHYYRYTVSKLTAALNLK